MNDPCSIPTDDAWFRIAELRFPHEEVWGITARDVYLINRYRDPGDAAYADSFSASTSIGQIHAPKELVRDVEEAYYRYWVQQQVDAWFKAKGLDLSQPTIARDLFEAAVRAEFGQSAGAEALPPPEPVKPLEKYKRYPADDPLVAEAVKGIKTKKFPNAWRAAKALAPRAEGSDDPRAEGSEPAKVYRLYSKIRQSS